MNFLTFAIKRAYWSNLKAFRGAFRYFGLTSARFELMFAIGEARYTQADVARALGVCRSTVCRMVHKLEKLGLVFRDDKKRDGRCFSVALTPEGAEALLDFTDTLLRKRILLKTHGTAFTCFRRQEPYDLLETMRGYAAVIAQDLGDRTALTYPTYYPEL